MSDMIDELLNGEGPKEPEPKVEPQEPQEPVEPQGEPVEPAEPEDGAPTAPDANGKHVPLAALEAVRKEKTDWKEKAIRAEAQLEEARRVQAQAAAPQNPAEPAAEESPFLVMHKTILNERLNFSEARLRDKLGDEEVDSKIAVFKQAMEANPSLYDQMITKPHPWEFAYKEGQRMLVAREIGDDPAAYRAKIEAELREKILSEAGQQPATASSPAPAAPRPLPASLAGARSSAARAAPSFTGPAPLENILG